MAVSKPRIRLNYNYRLLLEILALEAGFLAVSWLLNQYWGFLRRFVYADVLFIVGAIAFVTGSAGMMRSPYWQTLSPWGVFATQTQATEEEKHIQLVDELIRQNAFGLRAVSIGVITIVLSLVLTYAK